MLYVAYPIAHTRKIKVNEEIDTCVFSEKTVLTSEKTLFVSRRLEKNVKGFLDNIENLEETGWDEYYDVQKPVDS